MIGYTGPIEEQTVKNTYFRQVLFTGNDAQLVVMSLRPGEEIGDEVHPNVDQFFRIEQGEARFVLDQKEERVVRDGMWSCSGGYVPQRDQRLQDDGPEAEDGVLAAESPGWDGAQDQGRGRQGRRGGTPFLKRETSRTRGLLIAVALSGYGLYRARYPAATKSLLAGRRASCPRAPRTYRQRKATRSVATIPSRGA